jgi:hypothetical protein
MSSSTETATPRAGVKRPIFGRENLVKLLLAWFNLGAKLSIGHNPVQVNGQSGAKLLDRDGRLINVITIDVADGQIQTVRSIVDAYKLSHLGPISLERREPATDSQW